MDDQNKNNQNPTQPIVPSVVPPGDPTVQSPPVETPPTEAVHTKISPKESIKIRIKEVKHALGMDDPQKRKKFIIIVAAIVGVLAIVMIAYALIPSRIANPNATIAPSPAASLEPQGEPSEFADDPEVLRIMDEINAFKAAEDSTRLREDDLRLPTLDWNVNY